MYGWFGTLVDSVRLPRRGVLARRGVALFAAVICLAAPVVAQMPKATRPATIESIRKLLTDLGYVPGTLPGVWDTDTQEALWLYLGIENKRALLNDRSKTEQERYDEIIRVMQAQKQEQDSGPKLFVPLGGGISSHRA